MSGATSQAETSAFNIGKGEGLAFAALALSGVSFVQLLGAEKAILAIMLAVLALRSTQSPHARRLCRIAIALASVYILTILVVLLLFHEKLGELILLIQTLG